MVALVLLNTDAINTLCLLGTKALWSGWVLSSSTNLSSGSQKRRLEALSLFNACRNAADPQFQH